MTETKTERVYTNELLNWVRRSCKLSDDVPILSICVSGGANQITTVDVQFAVDVTVASGEKQS